MRILEHEVSDAEFSIIDTIMQQHLGSAPASAFSEATLVDCEKLTSLGLLNKKDFSPIGVHYLASPQLIGVYLREHCPRR